MAGAGLIKISPYQWTPAAQLAVQANGQAVEAARSMDKNRQVAKSKGGLGGLGGALGSIGGAALGSLAGPAGTMAGSMIGGALGGAALGAAGGGGWEGAAGGAGEGLGMGMAMMATGTDQKIGEGAKDLFGNAGLNTAADAAGGAPKYNFNMFAGKDNNGSSNPLMHQMTANKTQGQALQTQLMGGSAAGALPWLRTMA